ncbi:MAG: hypothetical protein JSR76_01235 [Verrucomicrobia bacterium]|nr:hypothetical protein [Verrucomicrobiota bacterium]
MVFKKALLYLLPFAALLASEQEEEGYQVNFPNIPMLEVVKFVSRVAEVNFVGDLSLLDFPVSFLSGRPLSSTQLLDIVLHMLEEHHLEVSEKNNSYFIKKAKEKKEATVELLPGPAVLPPLETICKEEILKPALSFQVYKLQYHQGSEILAALKQVSPELFENLRATIESIQWISSTNSLFFSGTEHSIAKMIELIQSLDTPLKQVFIEILVLETTLKNSLDFGLKWAAGAKIEDRVSFGSGSFPPTPGRDTFSNVMQAIGSEETPKGLSNIPIGRGFDLGIIGDLILHKGKTFFSLGALVSALQTERDCSIVLNQKILTQENKKSLIFVGDNIPFTGAVVQTVGSSQQTTANIEYRDVGVTLHITPLLGDSDVITLEISEEITEALREPSYATGQLSGITTSKTNMVTSAHVPNNRFLILSGMTRNANSQVNTGPPCLGGIPMLHAFFNRKETFREKKNILIFVKPRIVHSAQEYEEISHEIKPLS